MKKILPSLIFTILGLSLAISIFSFSEHADRLAQAQTLPNRKLTEPGFDILKMIQDSPSSESKRTSVQYALPQMELMSDNMPLQIDMNGDGLMDMVYSDLLNASACRSNIYSYIQFVLLNNGRGFEVAYSCYYMPAYFRNPSINCREASAPDKYTGTCAER